MQTFKVPRSISADSRGNFRHSPEDERPAKSTFWVSEARKSFCEKSLLLSRFLISPKTEHLLCVECRVCVSFVPEYEILKKCGVDLDPGAAWGIVSGQEPGKSYLLHAPVKTE